MVVVLDGPGLRGAGCNPRSSERRCLKSISEAGDERAADGHGLPDLRQLQGGLVQLRAVPDLRDPEGIRVGCIGRHDVTAAPGMAVDALIRMDASFGRAPGVARIFVMSPNIV
jgi:hypothetical protein